MLCLYVALTRLLEIHNALAATEVATTQSNAKAENVVNLLRKLPSATPNAKKKPLKAKKAARKIAHEFNCVLGPPTDDTSSTLELLQSLLLRQNRGTKLASHDGHALAPPIDNAPPLSNPEIQVESAWLGEDWGTKPDHQHDPHANAEIQSESVWVGEDWGKDRESSRSLQILGSPSRIIE